MRRPSRTEIGAGALVVAALAVGRVVTGLTPDSDVSSRPFEHAGAVGTQVHLRWGDVEVAEVTGSRRLAMPGERLSYGSPTVWVVASVDYTPRLDSVSPALARVLGGDGTTITQGSRNVWRCTPGNPGVPTHCAAAFEVPVAALPGARLVIGRNADQDNGYDDQAVVDLGVSKAEADRWFADDRAVPLPRADA